ncbi:DNA helicase PriA [Methanobacterium alcaliphilum]|uniref:DNA helicase PriA n=1 Tax=Methanobacterium alcaliphilum TaxID=392018 RepID=UPI00200B4E43|nr:DNA helicase PriA [Methanobacterium alcaliphilum]MCK9150368.1 DNA helicase PriA [Methanobacterium alcaliphilum]
MICKICGYSFDESIKSKTCKGCPSHNCKMAKCPNCGYENLPDKNQINFIKILKEKLNMVKCNL